MLGFLLNHNWNYWISKTSKGVRDPMTDMIRFGKEFQQTFRIPTENL